MGGAQPFPVKVKLLPNDARQCIEGGG